MKVRTGELEGFTAQDLLNLMNDSIYDNSKSGRYEVIKEFHPPTLTIENTESKFEDAVVNIVIWGRWQFYKWAYISLVSALTHSDIGKFKIRILIKDDKEARNKIEIAKAIFEPLGAEVVLMNFSFKYSIILKQEERYQMMLDSDTLLLGKEYPLFENLYNLLKADPGFYCSAPDDAWYSLQRIDIAHEGSRLPVENQTIYDYWEGNKNLGFDKDNSLEDILDKNDVKWTWNTLYGLDKTLFDTDKWRLHESEALNINWWDDEGVIQLYLWSEGIKIDFIRDLFNIDVPTGNAEDLYGFNARTNHPDVEGYLEIAESYISNEADFSIYHPTNWSWMLDKETMSLIFAKIFSNANEKMLLYYDPLLI